MEIIIETQTLLNNARLIDSLARDHIPFVDQNFYGLGMDLAMNMFGDRPMIATSDHNLVMSNAFDSYEGSVLLLAHVPDSHLNDLPSNVIPLVNSEGAKRRKNAKAKYVSTFDPRIVRRNPANGTVSTGASVIMFQRYRDFEQSNFRDLPVADRPIAVLGSDKSLLEDNLMHPLVGLTYAGINPDTNSAAPVRTVNATVCRTLAEAKFGGEFNVYSIDVGRLDGIFFSLTESLLKVHCPMMPEADVFLVLDSTLDFNHNAQIVCRTKLPMGVTIELLGKNVRAVDVAYKLGWSVEQVNQLCQNAKDRTVVRSI